MCVVKKCFTSWHFKVSGENRDVSAQRRLKINSLRMCVIGGAELACRTQVGQLIAKLAVYRMYIKFTQTFTRN